MGLEMFMLWTIIGFCSAYGVSSCPFCGSVLTATSMHTKPHLLNARARGLHCVYVSLVNFIIETALKLCSTLKAAFFCMSCEQCRVLYDLWSVHY